MTPPPPPGQGPATPPGYPPPPPRGPMPPMPPMMMMPPPPRRGGGSFVGAFLGVIVGIAFVLSLVLNLILFVALGAVSAKESQASELRAIETPIPSMAGGDPKQKVAVVRFAGVITDQTKRPFVLLLEHLRRDKDIKAIVLEVDSPGGAVTPSDELYDAILRLRKEKGIPVVVSMGSLAASGGYYMSMAGDRILAQETTLTGSIGVLMERYDLSGFGDKYGVKGQTIVSDGATYKDAGSMWRPMTGEETAYLKGVLNDAFATFKSRIASGRPGLSKGEIDAVANGKIYTARQALELKLIDQIGYLEDAIGEAAKLASLTSPHAVRIERELSLAERLLGGPAVQAGLSSGQAAGVNLTVDRNLIDDMASPRMMYLWKGQ